MADHKQTKQNHMADAAPSSKKVELDRIELPPEPKTPPPAVPPADDIAPAKPPAATKPAAQAKSTRDETTIPTATPKLPPVVKYFVVVMVGIVVAFWTFIGSLYLFDWLFSR